VTSRRVTPETGIAAFVSASAALMAAGYLLDVAGLPIHSAALAVVASGTAVVAFRAFREPAAAPAGSLALAGGVMVCALGYFLWLASPSLLPVTNGPDVVHHLLLIHVIHRTHHLVHDPALGPYLLEMVNYTPGSHIAAAAVGDWLRVDPLRVLMPLTAVFVAVKAGIVYVIALRVVPERPAASLQALAAPVLLLVPAAYVLGSFFQFFFYAQVVSETFAMGMVLAALGWMRTRAGRYLWLAAGCGVGVFLSWPIWIVPGGAAVLAAIVAGAPSLRSRMSAGALVMLPVALFAGLHAFSYPAGASIIGSDGAVIRPTAATLGVLFAVLGGVGALLAVRDTKARPLAVLLAVTILQALALAALDARAGSRSFYLPFKMVYLAVLPCACLAAFTLARAAAALGSRLPRTRHAAAVAPLVVAALLAGGRMPLKRQVSPISESALAAGLWARSAVPPGCLDYFSRHWLTGYWLHLDVLGNPRLSDRMRAETFEFRDTVGKWIEGKGLPYAIVEDLAAVPRDARVDMIPLREFGAAALVRNARPAPAPGADLESAPCRDK